MASFSSTGTIKKKDTRPTSGVPRDSGVANNPNGTTTTPPAAGSSGASWESDPEYINASGQYTQSVGAANSDFASDENTAASEYGYLPSFDANGNITSLSVDPNDPFSKAQLLQQHYDQSVAGSTNSMAARGQLYSGALQNAQNANLQNFQQGSSDLQSSYQDLINSLIRRRRDTIAGAAGTLNGAAGDSLNRALSGS